jgi:hypothetical protein
LASFLAPVAFVDHMKSPLRLFAPYAYSLQVEMLYIFFFTFLYVNHLLLKNINL